MNSRQTARLLLTVWLVAHVGCSSLASRGERGDRMNLSPEAVDLPTSVPGVSPPSSNSARSDNRQAGSVEGGTDFAAPDGALNTMTPNAPSPMLDTGPPVTAKPQSGQSTAIGATRVAAPLAEMSAFIQELDAASHIDAATRSQILATALQTPPQLQSQVIQQYRALLSLGQPAVSAIETSAAQPMKASAAPLPSEAATNPQPEAVVVASHREPAEREEANREGEESTAGMERQLAALLRKMKDGKVEAADDTAASEAFDAPTDKRGFSRGQICEGATWEQLVDSAIEKLEEQIERRLGSDISEEEEARLRMLYLTVDRRDDAVRAIASLEPEMQEYWSKQFYALAILLNKEFIADRSNRLIESKRNLDEALRRLGESSPLFVRNLTFITNVDSYGVYTPFDDYEFQPGEAVLLYAEVENYRCKETARGYHTALRSSYEIFDSSRQKVAEHEFSTNEEYCKNARRDFFTVCEFRMPKTLHPGKYVLRLTVADLNGDKAGESSITFHIRDE